MKVRAIVSIDDGVELPISPRIVKERKFNCAIEGGMNFHSLTLVELRAISLDYDLDLRMRGSEHCTTEWEEEPLSLVVQCPPDPSDLNGEVSE